MSLKNKKVLVTGAGGFIGSHLTEALVAQGASVKAFVHYNALDSRGWLDSIDSKIAPHIEVISSDIRDPTAVRNAAKGMNVVFHLAALIGIPFSYEAPDLYVDTNVRGTLNVLQAGRELGTERLVVTSTSEVYGSAQSVPMTEAHPLHPQSPYAASKVGADQLALSFHRSFATPVTVVRPFNTYGPRQSSRAVLPTVISQIVKGAKTLKLGALAPTRDFSFVSDTTSAFITAATNERAIGEVIHFGSGFEISVGDAARLIARLMDCEVQIEEENVRVRPSTSEVDRLFADIGKARELLGWQPAFSGLEGFGRGLKETITWFSNPANTQRYRANHYAI